MYTVVGMAYRSHGTCSPRFRHIVAILVVGGLFAAACGDDSDEATASADTVDASDAAEAGETFMGTDRDGYYGTPWPSEHADRWRTHAVRGGLPEGVTSEDLVATSVAVPNTPMWGYTRADHIYVLGGSPFTLGLYSSVAEKSDPAEPSPPRAERLEDLSADIEVAAQVTPYVAKIDPETMEAEILELTGGSSVNYNGGLLMHENGSIYAVARSVLYKIDGEAFTIEDTLELPRLADSGEANLLTTYNGIQVRANGQLILKGADMTGLTKGGLLVLVDPETLEITAETDSDAVGTARMTLAVQDGHERLYHSSPTESIRFEVTDDGFELDDAWTASYRSSDDSSSTQASSPVYMGDANVVVFANNTLPQGVTTPMQIFSQSTTSDPDGQLEPSQAFSNPNPEVNFFMVAADPFDSDIVVVEDQREHLAAAWQVGDDASLTRLWETSDYTLSAGAAIAWDKGQLYVDDRRCDSDGDNCTLWLVVLDLETGEHLAEVQVEGTEPSVSQMFVGSDGVYLLATESGQEQGYVNRVSVAD